MGLILTAIASLPSAAEARSGDILVTDLDARSRDRAVLRVDPVSGVRSVASSNSSPAGNPMLQALHRVTTGQGGDIFVSQNGEGFDATTGIMRVDPVNGARSIVSATGGRGAGPDFEAPSGLVASAAGPIFIADERNGDEFRGTVLSVDPVSGDRHVLAAGTGDPASIQSPKDVALEPNGGLVVINDGAVYRLDPATGQTSLILRDPEGLGVLEAVAVARDGTIYAVGRHVSRVDPASGQRTTVYSYDVPDAGPRVYAWDVAISDGGQLILTSCCVDGTVEGVVRMDPATGTRTVLSENDRPPGDPTFHFSSGGANRFPTAGLAIEGGGGSAASIDEEPPIFPTPTLSSYRFWVPARSAHQSATPGTIIRYSLSEQANVVMSLDRRLRGRRVKGRCRRPRRQRRVGRPCVRYVQVGRLSYAGTEGENATRFLGRLEGKALAPSRYRAWFVATDLDGNVSARRRLSFRVVERPR